MALATPPPVLSCARVIAYAHVSPSVPFVERTKLYVSGVLLGRVPALAVCQNLGPDSDTLLLHCDEQWNTLGATGADSVEAAIASAERNYPGLGPNWVHINTTLEAALAYYDANFGGRCSFCGKRAYEVTSLVEGKNASICRGCVEKFFQAFGSTTGAT